MYTGRATELSPHNQDTPMMLLLRWCINALLVLLVAYVVPGIHVASFWNALWVALAFGVINAVVRPILLILTLPISLITLGLFTLVLNAALFWFVSTVVKGFTVDSFLAAFVGSLILWLVSFVTNRLLHVTKAVA